MRALLRGAYPYRFTTYLDNPISPLPGAFLLGAPFVILFGSSAYQNVFWLAIAYLVVRRYYVGDRRDLLLFSVAVLALSPAVWQELATGGDLLSNSLYVFSFAALMIGTNGDGRAPRWQRIASALLLGTGLASRANYVLVLLPVTLFISPRAGWRQAARSVGLSLLVLALLVLPFYLYDPAGFSPLHAVDEVDWLDAALLHAGVLLIALMVLTAVILALCRRRLDPVSFLYHCALPQSVPVVIGLAAIAYYRAPANGYASFGLSFMFFGLIGSWALASKSSSTGVASRGGDVRRPSHVS